MSLNRANYEAGFHVIDTLMTAQGEELETLRVKADLLISASRFQDAAHLLYQLKKQSPEHFPIQILLAQALIGANQLDEASLQIDEFSDSQTDLNGMITLLKCWQKYYKAGISFDEPRIFGIGLSRTGTTSLTEALNILGYTTIHFINPLTRRVIDLNDTFYFDAFTDSPISFRFEQLYFLFPNAKFIYTERNLVDWVKSSSNLYKPVGVSTTKEMKAWLTQPECGKFNKQGESKLSPSFLILIKF